MPSGVYLSKEIRKLVYYHRRYNNASVDHILHDVLINHLHVNPIISFKYLTILCCFFDNAHDDEVEAYLLGPSSRPFKQQGMLNDGEIDYILDIVTNNVGIRVIDVRRRFIDDYKPDNAPSNSIFKLH